MASRYARGSGFGDAGILIAIVVAILLVAPVIAYALIAPRSSEAQSNSLLAIAVERLERIELALRELNASLGNINVTVPTEINVTLPETNLTLSFPDSINVTDEQVRLLLSSLIDKVNELKAMIAEGVNTYPDVESLLVKLDEISAEVSALYMLVNAMMAHTFKVDVVNSILRTELVNTPLDVRITNTPVPVTGSVSVTGTVGISGQPISVQVANATLDVRITNTPVPVTFTTPVRHFYVAHSGTSAVAANKVHLLVWNGGTTPIYVTRIMVASEVTAAVTGFQIALRVQRVTGYSGGTAVSLVPFDTNSPTPSGVTALTNPTVSGATSLFTISVNQEETGGDVFRDVNLIDCPIVVRPGQGIAITQYGTAGTGNLAVSVVFYTG